MLINDALNDFEDDPHSFSYYLHFHGTGLVGDILPDGSDINIFSRLRITYVLAANAQLIQPAFFEFLLRVTLDDELGSILNQDSQILGIIIAGIHSDQ